VSPASTRAPAARPGKDHGKGSSNEGRGREGDKDSGKETAAREFRSGPPMRGANCLVELFVPLEAAIHGGAVEASYPVNVACRECGPSRRSHASVFACAECDGSGRTSRGTHCAACAGTGRPRAGHLCAACAGTGVRSERKSQIVPVPAGAWDGQRLVVEGGGQAGVNGGAPGDAIFSVAIVCGSAFRRDGLNLACAIEVDFVTATLGGSFEAQVLGHPLQVAITANAQPGSTIRLRGQGLADRHGKRGDLTLQVVLGMPAAVECLSDDERHQLRKMFADAQQRASRVTTKEGA
jgi:molecular chaperone DnaJ